MYKEMPPDAMQPHDTWVIAFCPDTDSCVYAVRDKKLNRYKTYIYNSSSSEWIEIGEILTEEEEKEAELKLKSSV